MLIILNILYYTEHSNNLHTLVIRHFQNGDSLSEIIAKTLLSRSTVETCTGTNSGTLTLLVGLLNPPYPTREDFKTALSYPNI